MISGNTIYPPLGSAAQSSREALSQPAKKNRPFASVFVPIPRAARLLILGFSALYLLILVVGASITAAANSSIPLVIAAVACYFAVLLWPFAFYKAEYGWAHPLILNSLFTIANLVLRSTGLYISGLTEHAALLGWKPEDLTALVAYEVALLTLGQVALLVGFFYGPKIRVPRLSFPKPHFVAPRFLLFLGIAGLAFYFYARNSGTVEQHVLNFSRGRSKVFESDLEGIGQYLLPMSFAYAVALTWLALDAKAIWNPLFWGVAAFSVFLSYMEAGRRSAVIFFMILSLLVWMLRSRRTPVLSAIFFAVVAFLFFGLAMRLRESNFSGQRLKVDSVLNFDLKEVIEGNMLELSQRSGSGSAVYPILALVPSKVEPLYGRSYLENFYRFIPRQLFPDKPEGIDKQVNRVFFGGDWGLPPGVLGEAYWNFHVVGVLVVFFAFGVFKAWCARFYGKYHLYPAACVLYVINVFLFSPSQSGVRVWLFYFVTCVIVLRACGLLRFGGSRR